MLSRRTDLMPLGIVHNEEVRAELITVIEVARENGLLELWGYEGEYTPTVTAVPNDYELTWFGGPDRVADREIRDGDGNVIETREEGNHPKFPGLKYYCDVSANMRLRVNVPGGYLPRRGMADAPTWTQIQIRKSDFKRLLGEARRARKKAQPTPEALDEWMRENVQRLVKRASTIEECHKATGATFRSATAAFTRLPRAHRLGRGKKPPRIEIER